MALAPLPGNRRLEAAPRLAAPVKAPARPRLTVVIVNFCQWQNTARLTRQLQRSDAARGGNARIVIVDNNSPADAVTEHLEAIPGVRVERNARNEGFARAVNLGVRLDPGEWVLLLNPDVTVTDGFLDDALVAVEKAERHDPTTGVVGFQLRDSDGSPQASAGHFPTFFSTLRGLLLPRSRRKCRHKPTDVRCQVEWVTGGCLLVRADCFDALGGLDERFFLYYEDADFCRRVRFVGRSVWYDPTLAVTHHWPLHKRAVPAPLRLITRHALLTYAARHWRPWQVSVLRRLIGVEATCRRWTSFLRSEPVASNCYRELQRLTTEPRESERRRQLDFASQFLRPIASAQDGESVG
jgi:GT2 family glycosyltransferase